MEKVGGGGAMEHGIEGIGPRSKDGGCREEYKTENITSKKIAEVMGRDSLHEADDASSAVLEWVRGGARDDVAFLLLFVFFVAPYSASDGILLWIKSPSPCFLSPLFCSTDGCCFVPLEFFKVTPKRNGQSL